MGDEAKAFKKLLVTNVDQLPPQQKHLKELMITQLNTADGAAINVTYGSVEVCERGSAAAPRHFETMRAACRGAFSMRPSRSIRETVPTVHVA